MASDSQPYERNGDGAALIEALSQYLPYSLPLVRRLQFMHFTGGQTPNSHVLSSCDGDDLGRCFVVAYLDFSRGPETEMWLFSSIELSDRSPTEVEICEMQLLALLTYAWKLEKTYQAPRETPGILLIGSLHERVMQFFQARRLIFEMTPPNCKFIFEKQKLGQPRPLPAGLQWTAVQREDIPMILSKTDVPRKERTMILLPNVAISNSTNNELIAWAFLGPDGSLTTLHCEPAYRGQGLAKAIALKLYIEKTHQYEPDGLNHADVLLSNQQSQGVCKSLGGIAKWQVFWAWIDLTKAGLEN